MAEGVCMKRPLRIAMVAYAHYFTDARIKNYVDALLDDGATVDVFALGRNVGTEKMGRLTVYSLATKYQGSSPVRYLVQQMLFLFLAGWKLLIHSLRGRYDVIHVHNMPDILSLAALPFKIAGTKVILDVHDT
ncbi:glycosyltransferase family 4 protein, partial [Sphingobacteriales bacterium CHB3]|nr:glycosyltransferase family 4 protein [Sphingobacteriales bacterium CHB3]